MVEVVPFCFNQQQPKNGVPKRYLFKIPKRGPIYLKSNIYFCFFLFFFFVFFFLPSWLCTSCSFCLPFFFLMGHWSLRVGLHLWEIYHNSPLYPTQFFDFSFLFWLEPNINWHPRGPLKLFFFLFNKGWSDIIYPPIQKKGVGGGRDKKTIFPFVFSF